MKRALLAILLLLAAAPPARAGGTTIWPGDGDASTHFLFHLGDPTASPDPSTAAFRLGDFPQIGTPCILQANGSNAKPSCSSLTGFTAHAPLLLTGADLTLTLTDGTLEVNANALRRSAIGGDVVIPLGSNTAAFRNGTANSVPGRSGGTSGPIVDLASTATGDAFWNNGTGIQWSPYPYADLTGAPSSLPPSGAAGGDLAGSTYPNPIVAPNVVANSKLAQGPPLSIKANPTNATANEQDLATTSGTRYVPQENGSGAIAWGPLTPASTIGIVATWPITTTRYYCVDGVSGSDANAGFSDSSSSACGAVAKQTLAGLNAIFPMTGAGRTVIVAVNNDTTYTDDPTFLYAMGYGSARVTGTATNATASATAFAGDLNDWTFAGGVTVPGLNAGGYNPTGSPTTAGFGLQKAGGGAASLPAEPAAPLGTRIRFATSTATVALRGICRTIRSVTGGNAITVDLLLPAAPSTSDVFYIEQPGTIVPTPAKPLQGTEWTISGISFSGTTVTFQGFQGRITFSTFPILNAFNAQLRTSNNYNSSLGNVLNGGIRINNTASYFESMVFIDCTTVIGTLSVSSAYVFDWQIGSVVTGGIVVDSPNNSAAVATNAPGGVVGGRGGNGQNPRIIGPDVAGNIPASGLFLTGTHLTTGAIEFSNMGAHPAVYVDGAASLAFFPNSGTGQGLIGSSGNTDVGIDVSHAFGARINVVAPGTTTTVTGTAGDIRLPGGAILPYSTLLADGGYIDSSQNQLITGGAGVVWAPRGPVTITPIGAFTVPTLVGPGHVQVNSGGDFSVDAVSYVAVPGSNGLLAWTGSTTVARTLTNGDGTISFTNPDGVAGNPEIHVNAIPESKVTNLTTDLATLTTAVAAKVPLTRTLTMTAPMTCDGSSSCDLSTNRTIATPVFAGGAAGLVPPSTGSSTSFLAGDGIYRVPAGTGGSGTVTGVFGTAGRILVTPSSPNPSVDLAPFGSASTCSYATTVTDAWGRTTCTSGTTPVTSVSNVAGQTTSTGGTTPAIGLPNVGPGAVTTGGTGIASVTTDGQGRVVSMVTANYQAALSFPPANEFAISTSAGLTGYSTLTADPGTHLVAMDALAINGASPFPNSALIVNSATTVNRDRIQLYLGGGGLPAAGPTGDSTLLGIFPHDTAVEGGVTSGIYSTFRAKALTYTGSGQIITEATGGYFEQPVLSGVSGLAFALHAVGTSLITGDFGATGTVAFDSLGGSGNGLVLNDTFGDLRSTGAMAAGNIIWDGAGNASTSAGALMYSKDYYFDVPGAVIGATNHWIATSNSTLFSTAAIEYAVPYAVTGVHMFISGRIMANPIVGGIVPGISINVTKNGTGISGAVATFGLGVTGNFNQIFVSTTSFAAGDMLGLRLTSNATMGGGNFTGTVSFGWDQQM